MKYLKLFENFEDIHEICREYGINNYTINSDGSIDVDGDVRLFDKELTKLPLKFNHVSGDFWCDYNKLTTLLGSPQSVGGYFYCYVNPIVNIWDLFEDYSKVELLNDLDPIRDGDILMDRFNTFLSMIGKDEVESIEGYNCIN